MNPKYLSNVTTKTLAASLAVSAIFGVPAAVWAEEDTPYPVINEYGVPEGYMLIEGDILIPVGFDAATYTVSLWPEDNPTIIPFRFDTDGQDNDDVIEDDACPAPGLVCPAPGLVCPAPGLVCNQTAMLNAMAEWEAVADVDFRQCPDNECSGAFIHIRDSTNDTCGDPPTPCPSNRSAIGMTGGQQVINITSWCTCFTIAHELGHALGYWHEQSRADRDDFVAVNLGNVCQDCCSGGTCDHNFDTRPAGGGEYGPYDFDSVMHYGLCSWNNCGCNALCVGCGPPPAPQTSCPTITVNPPFDTSCVDSSIVHCPTTSIGQPGHLSTWDALVMSFLYPEGNWVFLDNQCGYRGTICSILGICFDQGGSFFCPNVDDLPAAVNQTPTGGTLWILAQDTYSTGGTLSKRMTIRAPLGATLTQ